MRRLAYFAAILVMFILASNTISSTNVGHPLSLERNHQGHARIDGSFTSKNELVRKMRKPHTLQIAGSKLPDCSHACGSCSPCRLVMISFTCGSLQEAETCPMAYKCICNHKSFPVP